MLYFIVVVSFHYSRPHDYGKIRLFGAIGWGIGALASTAALPDYESHFFVSLIIVTLIILPFTHFLEFHETGQGSSDGEEDDSDESDDGDNSTNDNSNENGGERGDDGDTENESETIKEDEQVDEREDAKLISNAMMNDAEDDGIPRSSNFRSYFNIFCFTSDDFFFCFVCI